MIAQTSHDLQSTIELAQVLDIRAAAGLKAALLPLLDQPAEVSILAHRVERLSTPCVQLLLAFALHRQKCTLLSRFMDPSEAFVEAFNILGLTSHLNIWRSAP